MSVDGCTQHLPGIPAVRAPTLRPSVEALLSQRCNPPAEALSFQVSFHGWLLTEGENKYTFNIKAHVTVSCNINTKQTFPVKT